MIRPIDSGFNGAVLHMAHLAYPKWFDVSDNAPESFAGLYRHVSLTGRITVWSGASDATIYADPSVNWAFRAWHDSVHLAIGADFSHAGEVAACEAQIASLREQFPRMPVLWSALLRIEVVGQVIALESSGSFVSDQVSFTLATLESMTCH